tara:strand:+ start:8286 stop:8849 length:564 start_codon:yes stop_codon:yes gene_type:complete
MLRLSLTVAAAAFLAGCGGGDDTVAASHDGGHAMSETGMAGAGTSEALAPLPDDGVAPVIDVRATWMRPHPQGRDVTAAYFAVYLASGTADRLVSARIDGADRVELHGHTIDPETGMMQMRPIGPQQIAAAGPLVFVPGGRHLMVFGLDPVVEGQSVSGALVFERAGEVPVEFEVRATMPGLATEFE